MFKGLIRSQALRRRTSWIIAGVLILPFILFFHATGQSPIKGPGGAAGVVFGKTIPWEVFQEEELWFRRQLESQFGGGFSDEILAPMISQAVWDRLMLLEHAKRIGLRTEDEELARFIEEMSAFQENGRFFPERYRQFLRMRGLSPQIFEERLRNDLLIQRLIDDVKAMAIVSDEEVRAAYATAHERIGALLFLFDPQAFAKDAAPPTEEELRGRYQAHPEEVRIPERLMVEYAGALREELASRARVSEEELSAYYETHEEAFAQEDGAIQPLEEVRELVHQGALDEQVRRQLTALALDLEEDRQRRLRFEEIVTARALGLYRAGPLSLGRASPELNPMILQAVSDLEEGRLSEVIETEEGVFIARVAQRLPARLPSFEEVEGDLRSRTLKERARAAAKQAAEALHSRLKDQRALGIRFEEAIAMEEWRPLKPQPFTRTEPIDGIGSFPSLNQKAFDTPLGDLTEPIETPRGFILLRPEERFPANLSRLAEEEEELREQLLSQRQSAHVEEWLKRLREQAKIQSFVDSSPLNS